MPEIVNDKNQPLAGCDARLANCPQWYLIPPPDINMRIPDDNKKCVVFFGVEIQDGASIKIKWGGTGFLVNVQSDKVAGMHFVYLATARHVAAQTKGTVFYIRFNTKDGNSLEFRVGEEPTWWFHPSEAEAADVAVLALGIPLEIFKSLDVVRVDSKQFVTDSALKAENIGAGDEVFIVGLFSYHAGNHKNIPIVRMGNIAMIPDEPVQTKDFGNMEAYLIEARSTGGISGSPVFVLKQREIGKWTVHLLGLIHGHWNIDSEKIIDAISADGAIKAGVNVGIAIISPAKKILDILNRKELADARAKLEADEIAKNSPTPD